LFIILKFVLGFTDFSFSEFSSLAAPASARFLAFFGALLDGWDALWGICSLFVALINNLRTKQHLKVLFLELSI